MPASLLEVPANALTSFEAYRAFQKAQLMTGIDDMRRVEAYLRELLVFQPDGTLTLGMKDLDSTLIASLVSDLPRDYQKVRCPALALYAQSMFDLNAEDPLRRRDARIWEQEYMIPFRKKSVARVKKELEGVEIVQASGTHGDFFVTYRAQVVREMRRFLAGP